MVNIDAIFVSQLDDNQKHAKSVFGKLLLALRKNNSMRVYALMGSVVDQRYDGKYITIVFSDKNSYLMLNNNGDISDINAMLDDIEKGLTVKFEYIESKEFDEYKFEQYLASEFGKIVTIK